MPRTLFTSGSFQLPVATHSSPADKSFGFDPPGVPSRSRGPGVMEHSSLRWTDRLRRVLSYFLHGNSSYGTALGDSLNGAGITAAWSLGYFLINSRRSLRLRGGFHPLSFLVVNLAGLNAIIYGSYYFLDADTARRTDI